MFKLHHSIHGVKVLKSEITWHQGFTKHLRTKRWLKKGIIIILNPFKHCFERLSSPASLIHHFVMIRALLTLYKNSGPLRLKLPYKIYKGFRFFNNVPGLTAPTSYTCSGSFSRVTQLNQWQDAKANAIEINTWYNLPADVIMAVDVVTTEHHDPSLLLEFCKFSNRRYK